VSKKPVGASNLQTTGRSNSCNQRPLYNSAIAPLDALLKEHFMADDPNEQSGQEQDPEQRQKDQDISKRTPTRQDQDEDQDDQQQGGQRRAS
jgi:hypothetical protein